MDNQSTPPNSGEFPGGAQPEIIQPTGPEAQPVQPAAAEAGHQGPPSGGTPTQSNPPVLSRDDVAAAIAAAPAPSAPAVSPATGPSTADDVDVIEPEWVDKAEEVMQQHQGDPYGEEEAVEDLQIDYLKKRFNYDVADPKTDTSKPEET